MAAYVSEIDRPSKQIWRCTTRDQLRGPHKLDLGMIGRLVEEVRRLQQGRPYLDGHTDGRNLFLYSSHRELIIECTDKSKSKSLYFGIRSIHIYIVKQYKVNSLESYKIRTERKLIMEKPTSHAQLMGFMNSTSCKQLPKDAFVWIIFVDCNKIYNLHNKMMYSAQMS